MVNPSDNIRNQKARLDEQRGNYQLPETIETKDLSLDSRQVLERFGLEAPTLLNDYCIALEDALIELVKKQKELRERLLRVTQSEEIPPQNHKKHDI